MAKRKKSPRYRAAEMELALLQYVRCGYKCTQAEKLTGVDKKAIIREWDKLDEEQKNEYKERAQMVMEYAEQEIIKADASIVAEVATKLMDISSLAIEELRSRLKDDFKRSEMKDADLISLTTKCSSMLMEYARAQESAPERKPSVTNIFNLLDNSVQENININTDSNE